jgi:hypothetical protein
MIDEILKEVKSLIVENSSDDGDFGNVLYQKDIDNIENKLRNRLEAIVSKGDPQPMQTAEKYVLFIYGSGMFKDFLLFDTLEELNEARNYRDAEGFKGYRYEKYFMQEIK